MIYEENEQIVVTELRDINEAPYGTDILLQHDSFAEMIQGIRVDDNKFEFAELRKSKHRIDIDFIDGWLPMPVYKPKK